MQRLSLRVRGILALAAAAAACSVGRPALADLDYTWNGGGGDDLFGTGANWVGGSAPFPGSTTNLFFGGTTRLTPNNNYSAGDDFKNIFFNSGAGSFTISGNVIDWFGKIENSDDSLQTINFDLSMQSANEINPVSGDLNIGSSNVYTNGNTLNVWGDNGHTLTFGALTNISGNGAVSINQNSNVVFQSSHTYSGETFINAGSLQFAQGGSTSSSIIRLGATSGLAAAALSITDADGGTTVNNNINVRGPFGGGGTKTISATNTSGTNTFSGDVYLDDDVTTTVSSGGTLALVGSVLELKSHALTVEGSGNTTISNPITTNEGGGTGSLLKRGTGTLTLTGSNSYGGFTLVRAGKLLYNGTLASGGSAVSVGDGINANTGTLGGNGTINRSVTLNKGGTISPGSGAGILTTGGQTWGGGGTYELDLTNSGHDEIHMTGSLSVTATSSNKFTVQLVQSGMLSANNWVTVATGTGLSGWNPAAFELPPEHEIRAFDGTNEITGTSFGGAFSIQVRAVPEPGSLGLFGSAAAALLLGRRRTRG